MLKKHILGATLSLTVAVLTVQAGWKTDITMLVVPREEIPIQIAQDISRRYPVLIVSYQKTPTALKLHAWNGESWVGISVEDYSNGTFFANRPKHAILVENEKNPVPAVLIPNSIWCESGNRLASTDPRVMLHLLGRYFDFSYRYWDQFTRRYGYAMEQINPSLINVNWWNVRSNVPIEPRDRRNFSKDMGKWYYLAMIPPPPIEPVVIEAPITVPEVEVPASVPIKPVKTDKPVPAGKAVPVPVKKEVAQPSVDTIVKVLKVEPAPAIPVINPVPAAPVIEPASATPVVNPVPAATTVELPVAPAAPAIKPEPAAPATPEPAVPAIKPEPAEPVFEPALLANPVPSVTLEPAVKPETYAAPASVEPDPFAAGEIPSALILKLENKKTWWKLF